MRILMINVVCGIRSTGRICTDLASALEAQGHEVKIAYGRENVPEEFQKYAVRIGSDLDVKLHGLKARLLDGAGFGSKKATKRFIKWVKEYDPDVIHLHNIHGYYINIEILFTYLKTCGKKIIWTLHDCWAFTGHTAYCDVCGCVKWEDGCFKCPLVRSYPKSYLDLSNNNWKRKKKNFQGIPNLTIVTPSNWLKGLVKRSFLCDYQVVVIHNGIDTSRFNPMKSDFRKRLKVEDKRVILGVATSWDEMKGLSDYYELATRLGDRYRVVLVGLTAKQINSIPRTVLGLKRTDSIDELVQIYSTADCYVNLSYTESFGLTNIEAQLCGIPVVAYDSGAMRESVGDGGIVVQRGNIDEVVNSIYRILNQEIRPVVDKNEVDIKKEISSYVEVLYNE